MEKWEREKQALQNWADNFGLKVMTYIDDDRRRTQRFFLRKGSLSVSPHLTYSEMNCFLNGIYNSKKYEL